MPNLCIIEQDVNLACVAKVRPVAHTAEDFQRDTSASLCGHERLSLQLSIKNCSHLFVVKIFEQETRIDGEASGESWVDVLHHLFHLLFVAKEQHAAIVSGDALDLGDDGVDYGSLVGI